MSRTHKVEQRHHSAGMGRQLQCVEALSVSEIRIGSSAQQQVHDVEMPIPRCPLQWCRLEFTSNGVNLGVVVQKKTACRHVSIDGCPVQRCDILGISS